MKAFWKYDLFPFCCSGTVKEVKENGKVSCIEYGNGWSFAPFHIVVDDVEGDEIKQKLNSLEIEYRKEKEKLLELYKQKSYEIAPFLKGKI